MHPYNRAWIEALICDFIGAALVLATAFLLLGIAAMLATR